MPSDSCWDRSGTMSCKATRRDLLSAAPAPRSRTHAQLLHTKAYHNWQGRNDTNWRRAAAFARLAQRRQQLPGHSRAQPP
eukprot:5755932-Prymnesium_polylepis.1